MFLSTNSAHLANWKYQESQGAQICFADSGVEALCFCLTIRQIESNSHLMYVVTGSEVSEPFQ